jgi:hypothetical protein
MSLPESFDGHLSDYRHPRLKIGCAACARQGDYSVKTLRMLYGNPPMAVLPRLVAIRGNCPKALQYPGNGCSARFTAGSGPAVVEYLGNAYHAGWGLILTCRRTHQGLKSAKACRNPYRVDLGSLVVGLGHTYPIDQLDRKLFCPDCGSPHYELNWIIPKTTAVTEPASAPTPEPGPLRLVR